MDRYYDNSDGYFEMPKTDSVKFNITCIKEGIAKINEQIADHRYNIKKPSLKILGHVKK